MSDGRIRRTTGKSAVKVCLEALLVVVVVVVVVPISSMTVSGVLQSEVSHMQVLYCMYVVSSTPSSSSANSFNNKSIHWKY